MNTSEVYSPSLEAMVENLRLENQRLAINNELADLELNKLKKKLKIEERKNFEITQKYLLLCPLLELLVMEAPDPDITVSYQIHEAREWVGDGSIIQKVNVVEIDEAYYYQDGRTYNLQDFFENEELIELLTDAGHIEID